MRKEEEEEEEEGEEEEEEEKEEDEWQEKVSPAYSCHLEYNTAFIVSDSHIIRASEAGDTPEPLQPIVECSLQPVGVGMPDTNCP